MTFDEGEVDLLKVVSPAECVIKPGECLACAGKEYNPAHRSIEPVYHSEEDGAWLVVLLLYIGFAGLHKWFITGAIPLDDLTGSLGDSEQMVVLVEYLHGSERHAATDLQRLSGDVGGIIREKEGDCLGDVLRSTCPTERDLCRPRLGLLLAQLRGHVCLYESRGYCIHAYATTAHLLSERLREANDSGLGGGVIGLTGITVEPDDRGETDDGSSASANHSGNDGGGDIEDAL